MLDATALSDFRACPEKYRNRHVLGLELATRDRGPLEAGDALHQGVELWFNGDDLAMCQARVAKVWGPDPLFPGPKPPKYTQQFLCDVMAGYAERWPREGDPWELEANESYFESPDLAGGWCGIKDRCLRHTDGSRYVSDLKTTRSYELAKNPLEHHRLSTQFRGYVASELAAGRQVDGVLVDQVFLDTRGHKIKPEHFQRIQIRFTTEQLDQWQRDVEASKAYLQWLQEHRGSDVRWPQHEARCFDYFSWCPYRSRCVLDETMVDSVDHLYKVNRWDPKAKGAG